VEVWLRIFLTPRLGGGRSKHTEPQLWAFDRSSAYRRHGRTAQWAASWFVLLAGCCLGDQVKKDEMGGTCGTCGREVLPGGWLENLNVITRHKWEDSSESGLAEIGWCGGGRFNLVRMGRSCEDCNNLSCSVAS
jgi:hypothetical protein